MASISSKIICLGMPRSGSTSLRKALQILGVTTTWHLYDSIVEGDADAFNRAAEFAEGPRTVERLLRVFDPYQAVLDYPGGEFPDVFFAAYPDAKFILNIRDPEVWEASFRQTMLVSAITAQTITKEDEDLLPDIDKAVFRAQRQAWWCQFGHPATKEELIDYLKRHIEHVKELIPSSQLLIFRVGEDGWDKLCSFLGGVPPPQEPFPHLNVMENMSRVIPK